MNRSSITSTSASHPSSEDSHVNASKTRSDGSCNNRARLPNPESPAESRSSGSKRKRRRNLLRLFTRSRRDIHNNNRRKSRNWPSTAHPQSIHHRTDPQREDRDHGRTSRPRIREFRQILDSQLLDTTLRRELFDIV